MSLFWAIWELFFIVREKKHVLFFTFGTRHKGHSMKKGIFLSHIALVCVFTACGGDSPSQPSPKDDSSASESSSSLVSPISLANASSSSEIAVVSSSSQEHTPSSGDGASTSSSVSSAELSSSALSIEKSSNSNGSHSNYNPETGILTDERDGEVYRTAKIGDQIWMAQNLRFIPTTVPHGCSLYEANYPDSIMQIYGQKYSWIRATNIDCEYKFKLSFNETDSLFHLPHQGICPKGWHIPTSDEWQTLLANASVAQLTHPKWKNYKIKGTDDYGMSLGLLYEEETFENACYIMTNERDASHNYCISFINDTNPIEVNFERKDIHDSYLRCLMD